MREKARVPSSGGRVGVLEGHDGLLLGREGEGRSLGQLRGVEGDQMGRWCSGGGRKAEMVVLGCGLLWHLGCTGGSFIFISWQRRSWTAHERTWEGRSLTSERNRRLFYGSSEGYQDVRGLIWANEPQRAIFSLQTSRNVPVNKWWTPFNLD